MMTWHDYLALALFAAAAIIVASRAYRVLFGRAKPGCTTGCSSCSSNSAAAPKPGSLISIGLPPEKNDGEDLRYL